MRDFSKEPWVEKARQARFKGGCTWAQTAKIVGKTVNQVRYALDDKFREYQRSRSSQGKTA